MSRNLPGFLIASSKGEYVAPKAFVSNEEKLARQARVEEKKNRELLKAKIIVEKEEARQQAA